MVVRSATFSSKWVVFVDVMHTARDKLNILMTYTVLYFCPDHKLAPLNQLWETISFEFT